MIDIDSIGVPPVIWMSGDTHMIDLDSIGAQPGILDGRGHSYEFLEIYGKISLGASIQSFDLYY